MKITETQLTLTLKTKDGKAVKKVIYGVDNIAYILEEAGLLDDEFDEALNT